MSKIRLTGGEPTLRKDIVPLTAALSSLPGVRDVGITTNALALRRKLEELQAAGAFAAYEVAADPDPAFHPVRARPVPTGDQTRIPSCTTPVHIIES